MAIKSLSSLSSKLSSVLSPSLQLSTISSTVSNLLSPLKPTTNITDTLTGLLGNLGGTKSFDFSALTKSLPQVISTIQSLTSNNGSNSDALKTLMTTLQPLLQNLGSNAGSTEMNQLVQSLPTIVNSLQSLLSSTNNQANLPDNISSAVNAIKPLLAMLGSATGSTDSTQIINTLSQVLEYAQPIIQMIGSSSSGNIDFGQIAQGATTALLPLLASINKDNSTIDMEQLSHALPTVIGSVTNLVTAISSANQGNIPETISGVIKGLNPLLDLLAKSDVIDTDQAQTVKAIYDVLNSVSTILDVVNNPSLLTLSTDLNQVINSLKPVIALMDSNGEATQFLDQLTIPDLGDLLGNLASEKIDLGSITDQFNQLTENLTGQLPNINDLLENLGSAQGDFDISTIIPSIKDAIGNIFYPVMPLNTLQADSISPVLNIMDIQQQSYI